MKERFSTDARNHVTLPIEEQLRINKQVGFQNVTFIISEFEDIVMLKKWADFAHSIGLNTVNIHPPFMRNCNFWLDNEDHDKIFTAYIHCIDACAEAGVASVTVHPTSIPTNVYVSELGLETHRKLVEHAEERGILLYLENLRTPIHLDYLFDNIKSDNLRFCLDIGHENVYNHGIDFAHRYADRFGFTHLHDNDGADDLHLIPLDGKMDWRKIAKDFSDVGYAGFLNLEASHPQIAQNEEIYLKHTAKAFHALSEIFGE